MEMMVVLVEASAEVSAEAMKADTAVTSEVAASEEAEAEEISEVATNTIKILFHIEPLPQSTKLPFFIYCYYYCYLTFKLLVGTQRPI